jgi:hypothetical protein
MTGPAWRSDRGQAGIALIIVIAWGLVSVLMLTRTLVAAESIDRHVDVITSEVGEIKGETSLVAELVRTEQTASDILTAANPITGQLETIDGTAKNINSTFTVILPTAQEIGGLVTVINGQVQEILTTASIIEDTLSVITDQAISINSLVKQIKADTGAILADTAPIRYHTCRIDNVLIDPAGVVNPGAGCGSQTD